MKLPPALQKRNRAMLMALSVIIVIFYVVGYIRMGGADHQAALTFKKKSTLHVKGQS